MYIDSSYHCGFLMGEIEMDFADNAICENAACNCPVVEAGTFCSDYCRGNVDAQTICDCEHSSCATVESRSDAQFVSALAH